MRPITCSLCKLREGSRTVRVEKSKFTLCLVCADVVSRHPTPLLLFQIAYETRPDLFDSSRSGRA